MGGKKKQWKTERISHSLEFISLFVCLCFYRFGADVMELVASWTKGLCIDISHGQLPNHVDDTKSELVDQGDKYLSTWSVLDIGTGNGLLLQELAKQGYA